MNERAKAFEKDINRQEKQMLHERASRIKKGGFKSEHDYFSNVNPMTGKRRESKSPKSKALRLDHETQK